MAVITMSASLVAGNVSWSQMRYEDSPISDASGAIGAKLKGPPRWRLSMRSPNIMSPEQAGVWASMIASLRGRVNHLAAWDIGRPVPRGTLRGTMTISGGASAGASSITIAVAGSSGSTLLAGDWLQLGTGLGSQLVMVTADASGGASITVNIEPPLRATLAGGTAVTWDKALGYYKLIGEPGWSIGPALLAGGAQIDLLEQWA